MSFKRNYNLINHFDPKFLLGLTATPERMDGGNLLSLCHENLVYRCDAFEGIEQGLLCKFKYFGVPDDVDYSKIKWRSNQFDEVELTNALAKVDGGILYFFAIFTYFSIAISPLTVWCLSNLLGHNV